MPGHFPLTVAGKLHLRLRAAGASGPSIRMQYQVGHDVTLMRGAHQFAVGGTWAYDDVVSLAHSRGVGGITISANNTGNALGDFMLGTLTEMRQSMPSTHSPSQQYVGLYAQDTWRMNDRAHAELWRPVGAVLPVRVAGESVRRHPRLQLRRRRVQGRP